ncbi:2-dehydropantoate 2-reductase [Variovorax saccharolyticus]|uniref:2-dehydropantoate 2-reductase n=1 Tax=Variovorax saccharolyticus TaxID=3053516 RepID=UPI002578992B|nr:2-dehydropantoate 2-reductase [Variovorax sp. J22R187]MDM0016710.1 2-dehydropantoate 2-reductase [Variovorax sp. J22R187]
MAVDILVMGAGTIGSFIGGSLAAAGVRVGFVGRPRVLGALALHGITLSDLEGRKTRVPAAELILHERVPEGLRPSLVLLTVKSGATAEAAAELAAALPAGSTVVSLQNGVANARVAAQAGPGLRVLPGMVPYNVAEVGPGAFHRGTDGRLAAQADDALRPWVAVFERAGIPIDLLPDMLPVQWGKLLFNLNNPVNALSGLPLREQLLERDYRRCFAALIDEALAVLARAGIEPAQLGALPAARIPPILRLPTPLFRLVAARMLRIDAKARSSMADDLALGRSTEIDVLSGEVVRLAESHGMQAPFNARMVELVQAWPERRERWPARQLLTQLGR